MTPFSSQTPKTVLGWKIRVRGLVQGVGFRPFVWNLAHHYGLVGKVLNDGRGVLIFAWGSAQALANFRQALEHDRPPLSRIDTIECEDHPQPPSAAGFVISPSAHGHISTEIAADARTCDACMQDIRDHKNRRFRYPFTNCTHCGPRLSITRSLPYDRSSTSMASFAMCVDCRAEYENPADRRFHAQPNACPKCGPEVWLCDGSGQRLEPVSGKDALSQAADFLKQGHILAIKGIGGFQLGCDATNADAVVELRARKNRYSKPLAVMAADIATIEIYAHLSSDQASLLQSAAAPIVLLRKNKVASNLAPAIAPDYEELGFMLPNTPLHEILLNDMQRPLVMTSANRSNEPQLVDNTQALEGLAEIADYWLMHDRDIVNRVDDSVVQFTGAEASVLRRARGYAPMSVALPQGFESAPNILAVGAGLKNTFCMVQGDRAIVSQHIGDLSESKTYEDFQRSLTLYQAAYNFTPDHIATDMFAGYLSTQLADRMGEQVGCSPIRIQHHHAHIAACMVEHKFPLDCQPVIGVVLDGLGYGDDGALWGGEFLIADYRTFERKLFFNPVAIPGGDAAAREPWRNTFAHLDAAMGWEGVQEQFAGLDLVKALQEKPLALIRQMIAGNLNAPKTSSAGRLFDAVAGALGVCQEHVQFEAQAAMELEALAAREPKECGTYPFEVGRSVSFAQMWPAILNDLSLGCPPAVIAARFHNAVVAAVSEAILAIAKQSGHRTVVLTGGVFQNKILAEGVMQRVSDSQLDVFLPRHYPANDGGIALGQAVLAAAQVQRNQHGVN